MTMLVQYITIKPAAVKTRLENVRNRSRNGDKAIYCQRPDMVAYLRHAIYAPVWLSIFCPCRTNKAIKNLPCCKVRKVIEFGKNYQIPIFCLIVAGSAFLFTINPVVLYCT